MSPSALTPADLDVPRLTAGARRILEVATELFYRHGIHAVGVDTIAAESGVTKRTLYDRFGSKDGLITVCLQARHQAWWARLEERVAGAPNPRVLAVFAAYAEDQLPSDRGCAFLNAAAELPSDHPGYRVIRAHKKAVRQRIGELLRQDRPDLNDPEEMADRLFLLVEGAISHRGIDGDDRLQITARTMAERMVTVSGQ